MCMFVGVCGLNQIGLTKAFQANLIRFHLVQFTLVMSTTGVGSYDYVIKLLIMIDVIVMLLQHFSF